MALPHNFCPTFGEHFKELKALAAESSDRESFKAAVQKKYPQYSGENYLDMTAGFVFA